MKCFLLFSMLLVANALDIRRSDTVIFGRDGGITHEDIPGIGCLDDDRTCSAVVVSARSFLTAAHCVERFRDADRLFARFGSDRDEDVIPVPVQKCIIHPQYNEAIRDFDISVCTVDDNIEGRSIRRVIIAEENPIERRLGRIIGSGINRETDVSTIIRDITVPILDISECRRIVNEPYITDRMICSGAFGAASCRDSDIGPLTNDDNELLGIPSWHRECAQHLRPGIFTYVLDPAIRSFIREQAGV
ncbi:hypothetical protein DMENIID0001_154480 [Sergentomyia squamirostris]